MGINKGGEGNHRGHSTNKIFSQRKNFFFTVNTFAASNTLSLSLPTPLSTFRAGHRNIARGQVFHVLLSFFLCERGFQRNGFEARERLVFWGGGEIRAPWEVGRGGVTVCLKWIGFLHQLLR